MTRPTEFASGCRSIASAYQSLAQWAGVPLDTVVEHAQRNALNELIETRELSGPVKGSTALRRILEMRYAPGQKPPTPAERIGELRARRAVWEAEEANPRDPLLKLAELRRQRASWRP
jgi:hypothetical protein